MPITQYNSSVRQMSQSKFNSMKNASGKIPDLANQIVMTNSEDENYDYLRMKLLWTNSNPTGAFVAQTISIDLSNYDLFLISFNIRPLTRNIKYSEIMHKGDTDLYLIGVDLDGNRKDRSVSINNAGITFGSSSTDYTDEVVPYQIYGILKTPSMIYTGDELIAGNGISIANGVISSTQVKVLIEFTKQITTNIESTSETTITGLQYFTKKSETSKLLVFASAYIQDNTGGYGSGLRFYLDSNEITSLSNASKTHSIMQTLNNISAGQHSYNLALIAGAGKATIPSYNVTYLVVLEVE